MSFIKVIPLFFMHVLMLLWMLPFFLFGVLTNLIEIGFRAGYEISDNYADECSQRRIDKKTGSNKSRIQVR